MPQSAETHTSRPRLGGKIEITTHDGELQLLVVDLPAAANQARGQVKRLRVRLSGRQVMRDGLFQIATSGDRGVEVFASGQHSSGGFVGEIQLRYTDPTDGSITWDSGAVRYRATSRKRPELRQIEACVLFASSLVAQRQATAHQGAH